MRTIHSITNGSQIKAKLVHDDDVDWAHGYFKK